jgi:large subunit ribosomal protein L29
VKVAGTKKWQPVETAQWIGLIAESEFMKADKIRNLTDDELHSQERELADQLFKLKFQLNMGQTESLKKIRGLRKDIARVKTIMVERTGERQRSTATEKR